LYVLYKNDIECLLLFSSNNLINNKTVLKGRPFNTVVAH